MDIRMDGLVGPGLPAHLRLELRELKRVCTTFEGGSHTDAMPAACVTCMRASRHLGRVCVWRRLRRRVWVCSHIYIDRSHDHAGCGLNEMKNLVFDGPLVLRVV